MADVLTDDQRKMLADFLLRQTKHAHAWGSHDCGLFLADWIVIAKGIPDPAADVRGLYSDRETCEKLVSMFGGIQGYVVNLAVRCGLNPTDEPRDGDVGIIDMPKFGPTCGIMSRGSWAFRAVNGLVWSKMTPGRRLAAWGVF